ncbi:MAG: choice-of-anchor B family protein [Fimbriimonadales bacterium]
MRKLSFIAAAFLLAVPAVVNAQFTFNKVRLAARIDLTTTGFNANSGNDCWGYVSPSGREYAIMGCSNKVAFVEITNPDAPVYFDSIPHGSSTWGDITVYQNVAYVVTERSGSGIQVIDLANIDATSNRVSLVRTIDTVGQSHNVRSDNDSGFLYTVGSRESSGTTTCWSLADPRNPVRVGANSMTGNIYTHDAFIFTYPVGSVYAGRQILFSSSAFDAVTIWDVTNKNNPFLINTMHYPNEGYTHQSWMSEDMRYMYLNDEFDETTFNITTRTIVFDIENIETGAYVANYTNGNTSIDHNLHIRDGYIFASNYTSGLRIFSSHLDPLSPTEVGWFDTHPEGDVPEYEGAWSNWCYFPSGTIIVSDINRGLFVLDAEEAMTRHIAPMTYTKIRGVQVSGNLGSLITDDDNRLELRPGITFTSSQAPVEIEITATADSQTPVAINVLSVARASAATIQEKIELFNYTSGLFELVDTRMLSTTDSQFIAVSAGNLNRFVGANKAVRARFSYKATGPTFVYPWTVGIDKLAFLNCP